MKIRIIIAAVMFAVVLNTVHASAFYDDLLWGALKADKNIMFAYTADTISGEYIITASARDNEILISAYDDLDGEEKTDELLIYPNKYGSVHAEIVTDGEYEYLLTESSRGFSSEKNIYTIADDRFTKTELANYKRVTRIAGFIRSKFESYGNTRGGAYNLLNDLHEKRLEAYRFTDVKNAMDSKDEQMLRFIISSCADIMSYDSKDYDFDTLMKYILNTHRNFIQLSLGDPGIYSSDSGNGIRLVRQDFIDRIVTDIFGLEPQHPYVNELSERGFCVNNGYYYYMPAFNIYYSTELRDIKAVYDLGGGIYYTVFTDIYTEGSTSVPEYSFAVIKAENNGLRLLRLGMGERLLSEAEAMEYSPQKSYTKFPWENKSTMYSDSNESENAPSALNTVLISAFTASLLGCLLLLFMKRV